MTMIIQNATIANFKTKMSAIVAALTIGILQSAQTIMKQKLVHSVRGKMQTSLTNTENGPVRQDTI